MAAGGSLNSSLVFAPNFFLKCIFIKRKKKWKVTEGIHPSSHIVQAEQEVLSHLPYSLFGQVCVTVRNMAPFTKGHCPSIYPVNARCSICKRHVPVQFLARGLKNPPRDVLFLPLLYVSYVAREFGGDDKQIQFGAEMTLTSYQLPDHRKRPCTASPLPAATPARTPAPRTPPAAPHSRPALSAAAGRWTSFPSPLTQRLCSRHLRPNCAEAVFVRRAFSPRGEAPGLRNCCLALPRGSDPPPSPLPTPTHREG